MGDGYENEPIRLELQLQGRPGFESFPAGDQFVAKGAHGDDVFIRKLRVDAAMVFTLRRNEFPNLGRFAEDVPSLEVERADDCFCQPGFSRESTHLGGARLALRKRIDIPTLREEPKEGVPVFQRRLYREMGEVVSHEERG